MSHSLADNTDSCDAGHRVEAIVSTAWMSLLVADHSPLRGSGAFVRSQLIRTQRSGYS